MESGLSLGYADFCGEVGRFVGFGKKAVASYSAIQIATIDTIVQSGIRRVYYPTSLDANTLSYDWSWMHPTTTLSTTAEDSDYDLPDDFHRVVGTFYFAPSSYYPEIQIISVGKVLQLRACYDASGHPKYAATRFKVSTGVTGQRQEVLFYPKPDSTYILSYEYEAYSGPLSETYPYPLGGMELSELYLESCLAVAEMRMNDTVGLHNQQYHQLLLSSIARDQKRGARYFGQMGNKEVIFDEFKRGFTGAVYPITYNGELI